MRTHRQDIHEARVLVGRTETWMNETVGLDLVGSVWGLAAQSSPEVCWLSTLGDGLIRLLGDCSDNTASELTLVTGAALTEPEHTNKRQRL
jgi:hypothetical protein